MIQLTYMILFKGLSKCFCIGVYYYIDGSFWVIAQFIDRPIKKLHISESYSFLVKTSFLTEFTEILLVLINSHMGTKTTRPPL